jgi:chaperonin cofactor prefoldin
LSSIQEIFYLERQVRALDEALARYQLQLQELKEALEWIEKLHPKAVYRVFGGRVAVEVDPSKAKEIIEDEIKLLEAKIETLKKRREELERKLKELAR